MLYIGICDDEKTEVNYLKILVDKWARLNNIVINVSSFDSAEAFLFSYETDKSIDILLLDIQMKQLDGITLAKKIRTNDGQIQIVFITGFPDFIAEGYEVSALHYLMKPVNEEKLFTVLDRATILLNKVRASSLFETENGQVKIFYNEIQYAEAFAHKTILYTINGDIDIRQYISDLAEMFGGDFCLVHRSYLVNLQFIRKITKTEVLMDNGKVIPLSRRRYDSINRAFIQFHRGTE